MKKRLLIMFIAAWLPFCSLIASAHPGRTDSNGGHTNHSTGEYHYHHGYNAHNHYDIDGDGDKDCPYNFKDTTKSDSKAQSNNKPNQSSSTTQQSTQQKTPNTEIDRKEMIAFFATSIASFVILVVLTKIINFAKKIINKL